MSIPPTYRKAIKLLLGALIAGATALLAFTTGDAGSFGTVLAGARAQHGSASSGSFDRSGLPTPEPGGGMGPADRLAPPPMSDPPTQLELGHWEYNFSCMVCHGDRGQGLTPEWRSALDPEDQNCWQARCHGPSHPPFGFEIPKTAPLVIGPGALTGYKTPAELFDLISETMPWSYPGLFEDEVYWELTAYLAEENKVDLGPEPLGPDRAADILLVPGLVQTHRSTAPAERIFGGAIAGLLLVAAAFYWLLRV